MASGRCLTAVASIPTGVEVVRPGSRPDRASATAGKIGDRQPDLLAYFGWAPQQLSLVAWAGSMQTVEPLSAVGGCILAGPRHSVGYRSREQNVVLTEESQGQFELAWSSSSSVGFLYMLAPFVRRAWATVLWKSNICAVQHNLGATRFWINGSENSLRPSGCGPQNLP